MKHALSLLLAFLGQAAAAGSEPWLSRQFPAATEIQSAMLLREQFFFEIPVSKMAVAEERLAKRLP
jgi:hypothetical protein